LELGRGNVIETISDDSPAARVGLEPGDILQTLGPVPIHSFGDAQFALDKGPARGPLEITWLRGGQRHSATLELANDWKKSDLGWRASVRWRLVPSLPLSGEDLTADERSALGLSDHQLAFRAARLKPRAKEAGIEAGDIIIGIDQQPPNMTVTDFRAFIRREFLVGDAITLTVLRDGQPVKIALTLSNP
jgi:serine protease Do